jgi:hypothetical protein
MQHAPISRARYVQENRKMRFQEAREGWSEGRLTQAEVAQILGQCDRSFRRHIERYESDDLQGFLDKRLSQVSKRRAGASEVEQAVRLYKSGFAGWNVAHFHSKHKAQFVGARSYSWLKSVLQGVGVTRANPRRGKHASTHRWVPDSVWNLVVTMDDATGRGWVYAGVGGGGGVAGRSRQSYGA